jgi:flagellar hook-associated protein 1 FlgK
MGLEAALLTARTGLLQTQRALTVAANNVANADTAGYTRKTATATAVDTGGVRSLPATRDVDEALVTELNNRRAAAAGAALRSDLLSGIEAAHGSPETGDGIGDMVAALRTSFETLLADPSQSGQQGATVVAAQDLAGRLNDVSGAIGTARQRAQDVIVAEVSAINAGLRDIAQLTRRITEQIAMTGEAAALEDQRDLAIATLSDSIEVQALKRADGGLVLVARNGLVLPLDPNTDAFATQDATLDPSSFHGGGGTIPAITLAGQDVTDRLIGGRLAEAVALRDQTLPRYQAELDLTAATLAARFDAQGLTLFTDPAGAVPDTATAYAGSDMVGFAGRITVNPAVAADPALLRDGTRAVTGDPSGAADFTPNPSGGPASFTTLVARIVEQAFGTEAQPGVAWAAIATGGLGPDGTLSSPFGAPATLEGYAAMVTATQTADAAAAEARATSTRAVVDGLAERFAQRSGVDVDTEMAAMITLQNAYAANARVMSTVQAMWDTLLGAVR